MLSVRTAAGVGRDIRWQLRVKGRRAVGGGRMRGATWELAADTYNISKLFQGSWDLAVLVLLRDGPHRPRDLARMVADWTFLDRQTGAKVTLSPSRITEALRVLTAEGLVDRTALSDGWNRSVEYTLTKAGADLLPVVEQMQAWVRRHDEVFDNADGTVQHRRAGRRSARRGGADRRSS
ncbi:winged helix-turn-helix transcriptional regulator [Prauserella marina]|uniref:winged helix-turn-helix transcriptional regulator n=1 Tax=Prauserella marina TaxID=530584 RepID=UPI001FEC2C87|nr:helix-turn-helix domain-containing protein [Prauserella marina]